MKHKIKKLIGHLFGNRFTWGEFYLGGRDLSLRYAGGHIDSPDLLIFSIPFLFKCYIHIGGKKEYESDDRDWSYGFYVYNWNEDVVFEWGEHHYRLEFPWMFKWESTEILDFDRKVLSIRSNKDKDIYAVGNKYDQEEDIKKKIAQAYGYKYVLKNGTVQDRIATITCLERRTWRWKWFPWKMHISTTIDVRFNEEIGEESASWKGGCLGCGYDILPNETPDQCLRRMERERKF